MTLATQPYSLGSRVLGYRGFQITRYVEERLAVDGQAPSYGMISRELDMTKGDVCRAVKRLERRGVLSRVGSGRVRRIRLKTAAFV